MQLLSKRADCHFCTCQFEKAVVDATAALALDGGNALKPFYRRAGGQREMGMFGAALDTVEYSLTKHE